MSIPPLRHAFLAHIAADWEDFAELRRAASARGHRSRLSNAVSILVNEIRVSMAAALLSAPLHGSAALDAAAASEATAKAARLYAYARTIIADGRAALVEAWHFTAEQCDTVLTGLASAVGPPPRLGPDDIPRPLPAPMSGPRPTLQPFEQKVHVFLAAVAQGMAMQRAITAFSRADNGAYSHDDRNYYPADPALGSLADRPAALHRAERFALKGAEGEQDLTLFLIDDHLVAISSARRLRIGWLEDTRCHRGGLETLPDFIALPRDEQGRPIIPTSRVTALAEAADAWACELATLDGVTAAITRGKLVMPKISAPTQQTALRNHPSWEKDDAAKAALGPVIAKWLATGVLEYVGWDDRVPVLLQPCGAVPRGTAPFYRLIPDARFANRTNPDWGITYTTAAQLSARSTGATSRSASTSQMHTTSLYGPVVVASFGQRCDPSWPIGIAQRVDCRGCQP